MPFRPGGTALNSGLRSPLPRNRPDWPETAAQPYVSARQGSRIGIMPAVDHDGPTAGFRLLVAASETVPTAAEVRHLLTRLHPEAVWTDAAIEQLLAVGAAAQRWLDAEPDQAGLLVNDPAAAIAAMRASGFLDDPVDDLLAAQAAFRRPDGRPAHVSAQVTVIRQRPEGRSRRDKY